MIVGCLSFLLPTFKAVVNPAGQYQNMCKEVFSLYLDESVIHFLKQNNHKSNI